MAKTMMTTMIMRVTRILFSLPLHLLRVSRAGPGADVRITFFRRFSTIFGEKIGVLLERYECYDQIFA
jgi:hypothetical protein